MQKSGQRRAEPETTAQSGPPARPYQWRLVGASYGVDAQGQDARLLEAVGFVARIGLVFWREDDQQSYVADRNGIRESSIAKPASALVTLVEGTIPWDLLRRVASLSTTIRDESIGASRTSYQYRASYVTHRSAPVLVTAAAGHDFGRGPRLGWRWGFHRGSHGGPLQDEILVSAVYRGPNRVPDIKGGVRSQDLLSYLGILDRTTTSLGMRPETGRRG